MAKRKKATVKIGDYVDEPKKLNWKEFWKKFNAWYRYQSWKAQSKKIEEMLCDYIKPDQAKRIMKAFDLFTDDVDGGETLDDWRNQDQLLRDLYKIETKYR